MESFYFLRLLIFIGFLNPVLGVAGNGQDFISLDDESKKFIFSDATKGSDLVLVDFWASWCGPCVESLPRLAQIKKEFPKLKILALSFDDEVSEARAFLKKQKLTQDYFYFVTNKSLAKDLKIEALPQLFLYKSGERIEILKVSKKNSVTEISEVIKRHQNK